MPESSLPMQFSTDMCRIPVTCPHQSGLIYVVPAENSWVCSSEDMPRHALAGFFRELTSMKNPGVQELMQQWGIYYRQLPLEASEDDSEHPS